MTGTSTMLECTQILAEASTFISPEFVQELIPTFSLEFLLGAPGANVSWQFNDDGTNIILSEQFVQPLSFSESGDHALDAVEYYCFKRVSIKAILYIHSIYSFLRLDQRNYGFLANFS